MKLLFRASKALFTDLLHRLPQNGLLFWLQEIALRYSGFLPREALVQKGDTVLLAGYWKIENILAWREAVGESGDVIVVEADPYNYEMIEQDLERRKINNVRLIRRALWYEQTEQVLKVSSDPHKNILRQSTRHSPLLEEDDFDDTVTVQAEAFDNLSEDFGLPTIDFVHATISGAELNMLKGMQQTLDDDAPRLLIRSILLNEDDELVANEVLEWLRKKGYRARLPYPESNRHGGGNIFAYKL